MLVAGKYELLDQLGEGAMGRVFRARHLLLDLELAVKVLRPQYSNDATFRARFLREARVPHTFVHRSCVTLRDFGIDDDGSLYLTMDLAPGVPLSELIRRQGRLEPRRAIRIGLLVLDVLQEAHAVGILHRDIKPDNVMVDASSGDDQIKVMDFGIAKIMEGESSDIDLTRGNAIGTPLYMSPEQCAGEKLDGRSDLYSLAVVLYEMLCGETPFRADTVQALLMKHLTQPVPRFQTELGIPAGLEAIVRQGLGKRAEERFGTAREFSGVLQDFLEGRGNAARVEATAEMPTTSPGTIPDALSRLPAAPEAGQSQEATPPTPRARKLRPARKKQDAHRLGHVSPSAERDDDEDEIPDSVSGVRPVEETGHSAPDLPRAPLPKVVSPALERPSGDHPVITPYESQSTQAVDLSHPDMRAVLSASAEFLSEGPRAPSPGEGPSVSGRPKGDVPRPEPEPADPEQTRRTRQPPRAQAGALETPIPLSHPLEDTGEESGLSAHRFVPMYVHAGRMLFQFALAVLGVGAVGLLLLGAYLALGQPIPMNLEALARENPALLKPLLVLPGFERLEPSVREGELLESGAASSPAPSPEAPTDADAKPDATSRPTPAPKKRAKTSAPAKPHTPPTGSAHLVLLSSDENPVYSAQRKILVRGPVPGGGDSATLNGQQVYAHEGELIHVMDLKEGEQLLRIVGSGANGPQTREITVIVDTTDPQVFIDRPAHRKVMPLREALLVGQVREPYLKSLRLNGLEVELPGRGEFSLKVALKPGENEFVIEAEDRAGNIGRRSRTLLFRPRLVPGP